MGCGPCLADGNGDEVDFANIRDVDDPENEKHARRQRRREERRERRRKKKKGDLLDMEDDTRELDEHEIAALKRVDPDEARRLMAFDRDHDGKISAAEMRAMKDDNAQKVQQSVLRDVSERFDALDDYKAKLFNLFVLCVFVLIYTTVLYMQANVGAKYELTTTFLNLLSPRDAATGEISDSFDSVDDIYAWIDAKFLETFWQNPMSSDEIRPASVGSGGASL